MQLNRNTISIILLLQFATAAVVFLLTRAYYQGPPQAQVTAPAAGGQAELSTEQLIDSLQNHPGLNLPQDPMDLDRQANEAFMAGDYPQAAQLYQRVIDLAPHKVEPHNNLGLTLHYLGRSEEALSVLQRGTELDPRFQRIWLTLGFVNSGMGNMEEARQALQRAVELGAETDPGRNASEMLEKLP